MQSHRPLIVAIALLLPAVAQAQLGFLDRLDEREDSGIYSRLNQRRVDALLVTGVVGLALFEGTETQLGKAAWQGTDAALMTAVTTEVMKRVFSRPRPSQNPDPTKWFQGARNRSFPSGEAAMAAAFTTPLILAYKDDYPAVWVLAVVPAYMARARMASHAHFLTDVVAGTAIGISYGWYASQRDVPLVISITGRSTFIGLRYRF